MANILNKFYTEVRPKLAVLIPNTNEVTYITDKDTREMELRATTEDDVK
jgi:hypothetical protein